jgi:hypothetical protein
MQAVVRVASCRRQVGVFLITRSDMDDEVGASELFTMEVQKLRQQQQQQQQRQEVPATCSCQPQHPWQHTASPSLSTASSHRHLPYITGVFITPMSSAASAGSAASGCAFQQSSATELQALATEWEVRWCAPCCNVAEDACRCTLPSKTMLRGEFDIFPQCMALLHLEERLRL